MFCVRLTSAQSVRQVDELGVLFDRHKVSGSIALLDSATESYMGFNTKRCAEGFLPASTFKIPMALIALEEGVATLDTIFSWQGERRDMAKWEHDMTLKEAFELSCVPIFRSLARSVGYTRLRERVAQLEYGQMTFGQGNVDKFWLEGDSKISQLEQINFLRRLRCNELPLSQSTMNAVRQIMVMRTTDEYVLSGKTGWTGSQGAISWFVGYVEVIRSGRIFYFAINVSPGDGVSLDDFLRSRIEMATEVLEILNLIK